MFSFGVTAWLMFAANAGAVALTDPSFILNSRTVPGGVTSGKSLHLFASVSSSIKVISVKSTCSVAVRQGLPEVPRVESTPAEWTQVSLFFQAFLTASQLAVSSWLTCVSFLFARQEGQLEQESPFASTPGSSLSHIIVNHNSNLSSYDLSSTPCMLGPCQAPSAHCFL